MKEKYVKINKYFLIDLIIIICVIMAAMYLTIDMERGYVNKYNCKCTEYKSLYDKVADATNMCANQLSKYTNISYPKLSKFNEDLK